MKKILKSALIVSLSCLVLVACKKEDDDEPTKTKTQLLTAHEWKMVDLQFDPPLPAPWDTIDVFKSMPGCEKDDFMKFNTDGTGLDDEGATKCEPTDPQVITFSWEWQNGEKDLYVTDPSDTTLVTDVSVSATALVAYIKEDSPFTPGAKVDMKVTFGKK